MKVMLMPLAMAAMFFRTGIRSSVYRKTRELVPMRTRYNLRSPGHRCSTIRPRGVPQVQKHLRPGGEPVSGEVECNGRALPLKAPRFLKPVDVFHQTIRVLQIGNVTREWIIEALGTLHQSGKIFGGD